MSQSHWDVVIAGGGLGGATLGRALAMHGARVLIVERELAFKDRVRGEGMLPWGVAEARALGIDALMRDSGACEVRWWKRYLNGTARDTRDLIATTPTNNGCFNFYHPSMQQTLLDAARDAGAVIRRGVTVVGLETGDAPVLLIRTENGDERFTGEAGDRRGWPPFRHATARRLHAESGRVAPHHSRRAA